MRKVKNVFVGTILTVWYTIEMMWFKTRGYKIAMNSIYGSRSMKQKLSNKWREDLQNYITEHYKPE